MSDNLDATSLVKLVTLKGAGRDAKADARLRQVAVQTVSRGFDGFLQTFLGKGGATRRSSGFGSRDRGSDALSGKRSQNFGRYGNIGSMESKDKQALAKSIEKTVESSDRPDEEVAAAAEEAARLIHGMLATPSNTLTSGMPGATGGGATGGDASGQDAWQQAMASANANAEINNDATLAALDDLLSGLPRDALEAALGRAFGVDGTGMINQLASSLNAQVVYVGGGEAAMLAYLGGQGLAPGGYQDIDAPQLFAEFLKDFDANGPINTTDSLDALDGDELAAAFEKWLKDGGKLPESGALPGDVNAFIKSLAGHLRGETTAMSEEMSEFFAWMKAGLDGQNPGGGGGTPGGMFMNAAASAETFKNLLQAMADRAAQGDADGNPADKNPGAQPVQAGSQTADAAKGAQQPTPASSMSTMMEQIENIERLADAMRIAARGGIKNLTMQLTPDELGKVMLRVEAKDGVVSAYLRVEKPEAAAQLANNLQQLRENLKAQGIELATLDIQMRGENEALGDFGGGRQRREADFNGSGERGSHRDTESIPGSAPPTPAAEPAGAGGPGELNLFA
ncbi:MAG: flagellar hook-length control protein FliK [Planctomycetaceae bacterium]|nr:flagellar hook-length control protein FliK [Planctomycetaceae bacterium]